MAIEINEICFNSDQLNQSDISQDVTLNAVLVSVFSFIKECFTFSKLGFLNNYPYYNTLVFTATHEN